MPLKKVIEELNDYIYLNIIKNNKSFSLVTFGDELLTNLLPQAMLKSSIKLAPHY
jgi:hypothetical protein